MLRQDENIKSTILEDNFLLPRIFLKIVFVQKATEKQVCSHGHTELQHELAGYSNTSHEVEIMIDKNNIRQWTTKEGQRKLLKVQESASEAACLLR